MLSNVIVWLAACTGADELADTRPPIVVAAARPIANFRRNEALMTRLLATSRSRAATEHHVLPAADGG